MSYIYEYIKNKFDVRDGNFYDLGSGTGKAVIALSLMHPFNKCVGIEYIENLHRLSLYIKNRYEKGIKEVFERNKDLINFTDINKIQFIQGDFLKQNWEETSLMFANSTCFSAELMTKIGDKANRECKSGTIIITFTKKLNSLNSDWKIELGFRRLMTWGIATVYVYRRK